MQINYCPKTIFLFINIVLLSPRLHAEVKVLCLGEGECVGIGRNVVHSGSLSGASDTEQKEYEVWKVKQERENDAKDALKEIEEKLLIASQALADARDAETPEAAAAAVAVAKQTADAASEFLGIGDGTSLSGEIVAAVLQVTDYADQAETIVACQKTPLENPQCEDLFPEQYLDAVKLCETAPLENPQCEKHFPGLYFAAQCQDDILENSDCKGYADAVKLCEIVPLDNPQLQCEKYFPGLYLAAQCQDDILQNPVCKEHFPDEYLAAQLAAQIEEMPCYVGWQQDLRRYHKDHKSDNRPGVEIYTYRVITPMNHAVEGFNKWYSQNVSSINATRDRLTRQCHDYLKLGGSDSISRKGSKSPGICPYTVVNEGCAYRELSEPQGEWWDATCVGKGNYNLQGEIPNNCAFLNAPFNIFTKDNTADLSNIDDVDYVQYGSHGKYYIEQIMDGGSCTNWGTCTNWRVQSMYRGKTKSFQKLSVKPAIR